MNDLNQWHGIGRLGKDPETRHTPDGTTIANFSMACGWKGKDKEGTEWMRVVAFGKLAEIIGEYCHKGKQVYISGRLSSRKWQDKEGNDRWTTEIVADRLQLLGGKGESTGSQRDTGSVPSGGGGNTGDDFDDDIPFITRHGLY